MTADDLIAAFFRANAADTSREITPHHDIRVGIMGVLERVADHLDQEGRAWSAAELRAVAAMIAPRSSND